MAKPTSQMTDQELLRESDEWDKLSVKDLAKIWNEAEPVDIAFVDARLPKQAISLRLDPNAIERAKKIGERLGVGYQTLFRMWIMEGIAGYQRLPKPRRQRSAKRRNSPANRRTAA